MQRAQVLVYSATRMVSQRYDMRWYTDLLMYTEDWFTRAVSTGAGSLCAP